MEELADLMGVKIKFDYGFHEYVSDDYQLNLQYRTATAYITEFNEENEREVLI